MNTVLKKEIFGIDVAPSSKQIMLLGKRAYLVDGSNFNILYQIDDIKMPYCAAFGLGNKTVTLKNTFGDINIYDAEKDYLVNSYKDRNSRDQGSNVVFEPIFNKYVYSADWDGRLYEYLINSQEKKVVFETTNMIDHIAFTPNNNQLMLFTSIRSSNNSSVIILDYPSFALVAEIQIQGLHTSIRKYMHNKKQNITAVLRGYTFIDFLDNDYNLLNYSLKDSVMDPHEVMILKDKVVAPERKIIIEGYNLSMHTNDISWSIDGTKLLVAYFNVQKMGNDSLVFIIDVISKKTVGIIHIDGLHGARLVKDDECILIATNDGCFAYSMKELGM